MAKYISIDKLTLFLDKVKALIPTKMSELSNDGNFVSDASYVHTDSNFTVVEKNKLGGIADGANNYTLPMATGATLGGVMVGENIMVDSGGKISVPAMNWANINGRPTKVSDFSNDSNFITKAVGDLTNYYTKSNTYTKEEVNSIVGNLSIISFEVVSSLPVTGSATVIYLVPKANSTNRDAHDEYIWITSTSSYEHIGSTDVDLSGYWAKTDLVEATDADINALFS